MIALIRSSLDATPRDVNALCRPRFFRPFSPTGRERLQAWPLAQTRKRLEGETFGLRLSFLALLVEAGTQSMEPHIRIKMPQNKEFWPSPACLPTGYAGCASNAGFVERVSILVFALISWYERRYSSCRCNQVFGNPEVIELFGSS
jgi:hypothetical protein